MDPQNPKNLWASFWGDAIYKSTDGGATWANSLGNLPAGNYLEGGTRFSLGHRTPPGQANPTLYTGFDYIRHRRRLPRVPRVQEHRRRHHVERPPTGAPQTGPTGSWTTAVRSASTTTSSSPTPPTRTSSTPRRLRLRQQPAVRWHLPVPRRRRALAEPWVRPAPRLPRDRLPARPTPSTSPSATTVGSGSRRNRGGRLAPGARSARSTGRTSTATSTRPPLPLSTPLACRSPSSPQHATVPLIPGRYWGGTQDNGTLRKSTAQRRGGSTRPAVTAVRSSSTDHAQHHQPAVPG